MKRLFCVLLSFILMILPFTTVLASESEKYYSIPVEYSDNKGQPEQLSVMVKNSHVYVSAEMLASRLGYEVKTSEHSISIYNKDNEDLPVGITQFFYNDTKVSHMLFSKMIDTYEAPFASLNNEKGSWIPFHYALLILNSGSLDLGGTIAIDIPNKKIIDYYYDVSVNTNKYTFDWARDIGYSNSDLVLSTWISQATNFLDGIITFDGDSWAAIFQTFSADVNAYDKKYGEDIALLLCTMSDEELNASIEKVEFYKSLFDGNGQMGKLLSVYSAKLNFNVDTLYYDCEQILKKVNDGNSSVASYNKSYQALEKAFDKQTWFSKTGSYIVDVQKEASGKVEILNIGLDIAEVASYVEEFTNQDEFSTSALTYYLGNSMTATAVPAMMKRSMSDCLDLLSENVVKYSSRRFFRENIDDWVVGEMPLNKILGTQANVLLAVWNIASNTVPFISNGLEASDKFMLALYSQILQSDAFINYQGSRNSLFANPENITPDNLYNLSQNCYIYLKSCYIARNAALGSLIGKSDYIKEQAKPLVEYQNGINKEIAKIMAELKSANKTNEHHEYGFLPADNVKYLSEYNDSALIALCESTVSIFKAMPEEFIYTSGVGGWQTFLRVGDDGSFAGEFTDSNMGETGDRYPNGTVYICNFKGKFAEPQKVNAYTYSTSLESLEIERTKDKEYYEDGRRFVSAEAYGLEHADEILIYLPRSHINDLPEGFVSWARPLNGFTDAGLLCSYGIYSVNDDAGFTTYFTGDEENENELIIKKMQFTEGKVDVSYPNIASNNPNLDSYINDYFKSFVEELYEISKTDGWNISGGYTLNFNNNKFLSIRTEMSNFTEMGRGDVGVKNHNFNLETGQLLELKDIAVDEDLFKKFVKESIIGQASKIKNEINPYYEESISKYDFKNYSLNENGMSFIFNEYELASRSKGAVTFEIAYSDLKPYLKNWDSISQFSVDKNDIQSLPFDYILPDSSTKLYTIEELNGFTVEQLRLARNEIYARHGRKFIDRYMQEYFQGKEWYHGSIEPDKFSEDLLNPNEKSNIVNINNLEENAKRR